MSRHLSYAPLTGSMCSARRHHPLKPEVSARAASTSQLPEGAPAASAGTGDANGFSACPGALPGDVTTGAAVIGTAGAAGSTAPDAGSAGMTTAPEGGASGTRTAPEVGARIVGVLTGTAYGAATGSGTAAGTGLYRFPHNCWEQGTQASHAVHCCSFPFYAVLFALHESQL